MRERLADPAAAGVHRIDHEFSILNRRAAMPLITPAAAVTLASMCDKLSGDGRLDGFEVYERLYEIGAQVGSAELEALSIWAIGR